MMTRKNKIIASSVAAIAVAGGTYAASDFALNNYHQAILGTQVVDKVDSSFTVKNGNLFIESNVIDYEGYNWKLLSKINRNEGLSLKLTSKAFALDDKTKTAYASLLNPTNSSLNAIGETTVAFDSFHSDVRFKPTKLNTPTGIIDIPETALILDSKAGDTTLVLAALGNIKVDAVGNTAEFIKPRFMMDMASTPEVEPNSYYAKFDSVKVGLIEVSKATEVKFMLDPQSDGLYDLTVETMIEELSNVKNVEGKLVMKNITESSLSNLLSASTGVFSSDLISKTNSLTAIFNYAKVGGEGHVSIQGESTNGTPLNVHADLTFDEDYRKGITTDDVFSIMNSANLIAHIDLPIEVANSIVGPEWLGAFIRDGMVKLKGESVTSEIEVKNMDALINDVQFSL